MADPLLFTKGFVLRRNELYINSVSSKLESDDVYHSFMLRCLDGAWANWYIEDRIVSHYATKTAQGSTVISMGIDGRIQISDHRGFRWEVVDGSDEGPSNLRHLTCMRIIDQLIYVAGMARQVYRRPLSGGSWERMDQGVLVRKDSKEIAGFKSIDGFARNDIYAAGFYGQIWHYNGATWEMNESPTNVLLACVKCVAPDLVYICGSGGVVLRGHNQSWDLVTNEETTDTFWSAEAYLGEMYLATNQGTIYQIKDSEIVPVETELGEITTNWLHANDGVLLSTGSKDLITFDGSAWRKIPHP
jgi:hypothetical protein